MKAGMLLEQIRRELEAERDETREIPAVRVRNWMASDDADVRGATYALLYSAHAQRVRPELPFDDVFNFVLNYYDWCIRTDPEPGSWANTRYSAGWDLVGWFCGLWDERRDTKYFEDIKARLAKLYKSGDADLKRSIEHAIIEHLFERKQIRKFFDDWKNDPELKPAYAEGMLWITHGGTSALTDRLPKPH